MFLCVFLFGCDDGCPLSSSILYPPLSSIFCPPLSSILCPPLSSVLLYPLSSVLLYPLSSSILYLLSSSILYPLSSSILYLLSSSILYPLSSSILYLLSSSILYLLSFSILLYLLSSSILCPALSSVLLYPLSSSILYPLSSLLCPLSSALCPLSSDLLCPPLYSILYPLTSSLLCPLSSTLYPLPSTLYPLDGKRVALKKMPNVFQNLVSCKRVFRELKMLCFFKHENVLSALDILQPPHIDYFEEIYVVTELMQSDLHKIIVSPQPLSSDHAKVFLYQILRGLKYLHSAGILHRDIKPGNLLVNSNCVLKICDFGLARVEESDESRHMTQEVVTQYYRAPEILMGSRHYSNSIDIWSVGCIFAELLGRRILFQAQSPIQQLDLITDLLGTPSMEAMRTACEGARAHVHRGPHKQPSLPVLYTLSGQATHEAVHLLCRMLVFDPSKRISAKDALAHPYLDEGRLRYHTCMCKCCYTTSSGRVYTSDFEPVTNPKFDDGFEKNLSSVRRVKEIIHQFILEQQKGSRVPLCINPQSAAFKSFISSTVAQPSEMPPSPLAWE
uniref:mitogen-activated protein kinase n=1 Tax=Cyclopterus lumpus TaxID=8103 RepID=A0A8C2WM36_CYCLU